MSLNAPDAEEPAAAISANMAWICAGSALGKMPLKLVLKNIVEEVKKI